MKKLKHNQKHFLIWLRSLDKPVIVKVRIQHSLPASYACGYPHFLKEFQPDVLNGNKVIPGERKILDFLEMIPFGEVQLKVFQDLSFQIVSGYRNYMPPKPEESKRQTIKITRKKGKRDKRK